MKTRNNIIGCGGSEARTNGRWNLVLAAVAGVALAAVGCSTYPHAPADYSSSQTTYTASTEPAPRAVGAAETPTVRSSGYSTNTIMTDPTPGVTERTDRISAPAVLPPDKTSVVFVDHPVQFDHMRVERVVSDRELEVSSDDGSHFYVACDKTTTDMRPGDIVFVRSTFHDPNRVSTAMDKKGAFYLMPHRYWIQIDRLTIYQP